MFSAVQFQKDEAPAETPGRDSDVATGTTQVRHIQERVPADDETTTPATVEQRKAAASKPTAHAEATRQAVSRGTIPSGTYVALPESPCPRCADRRHVDVSFASLTTCRRFTDTNCLIQLLCGLISKTPARCGEGGVEIHHHSNSCDT